MLIELYGMSDSMETEEIVTVTMQVDVSDMDGAGDFAEGSERIRLLQTIAAVPTSQQATAVGVVVAMSAAEAREATPAASAASQMTTEDREDGTGSANVRNVVRGRNVMDGRLITDVSDTALG
ncbi:hypothetical protein PHYPSEUDO_006560 [Phytophthora pseudosyringae]|uniref:Uncharacterized protein n=1 Tax=Phytophthora pseudosyringae TaxID=221518 RepID=A0A8T1VJ64_9STRA|nr:hypothetical protein PHYPSEUDO_006560 [Phytophthora pseudosyringae]